MENELKIRQKERTISQTSMNHEYHRNSYLAFGR